MFLLRSGRSVQPSYAFALRLFTIAFAFAATFLVQANFHAKSAQEKFGTLGLTSVPDMLADGSAAPVQVVAVATQLKPFAVTRLTTVLHTSRPISDVQFGWYLVRFEGDYRVVAQGEMSARRFSKEMRKLLAKNPDVISVTDPNGRPYGLSIQNVLANVETEKKSGRYVLEIVAKKVVYADGEIWSRSLSPNFISSSMKAAFEQPATNQSCPNQACETVIDRSTAPPTPTGFLCGSLNGAGLRCQATSLSSCSNHLCSSGGGGGSGGECRPGIDLSECEEEWEVGI